MQFEYIWIFYLMWYYANWVMLLSRQNSIMYTYLRRLE